MWPWTRRRERFSLEELRYLTDQLQRTSFVNELNKDSVVETLRSIAELMIWGDQHDPTFFEHFMEKQVMVLFLHVLKLSTGVTTSVGVQLLQSLGIMIQNLQSKQAIYYIFSNGYLNHFITYPYDFHHEELLAYYISFLRTISTKLDRSTVSFFIQTEGDEVIAFPLYTEAIKFFRHEESMVRIAVRALTLNVYHVEDSLIRKFVASKRVVGYTEELVQFLKEKSKDVIAHCERLEYGIAETEEILDYCNDIIHAGIPELSNAMTDNLLQFYVLPLFCLFDSGNALPALGSLARVLNIVRHKPLANGIAAAIVCDSVIVGSPSNCTKTPQNGLSATCTRKAILSCIVSGNDELALMSVFFLLALLHSEVDDSLLDLIGLLPRLKQHKRRLLQALMGSNSDEELLFSSFSDDGSPRDPTKFRNSSKVEPIPEENHENPEESGVEPTKFSAEGVPCPSGTSVERFLRKTCCNDVRDTSLRAQEIVEKLVEMLCGRPPLSYTALSHAAALLWQIFPEGRDDVQAQKIEKIRNAYLQSKEDLLNELDDCWCDVVPSLVSNEWITCKKTLESLQVHRDGPFVPRMSASNSKLEDECSSTAVAERLQAVVKVFTLLHQIKQLLSEGLIKDHASVEVSESSSSTLKVGTVMDLSNAIPCRIAFERGKEREVYLTAITKSNSGWLLLAEANGETNQGLIRVVAPLSGCLPEIDEEHPRWLHLRIRPPNLPSTDKKLPAKTRRVDGRWTLAFATAGACIEAKDAVERELLAQKDAVLELLQPYLDSSSRS